MAIPETWKSGTAPTVVGLGVSVVAGGIGADNETLRFAQSSGNPSAVRWDLGEFTTEVDLAARAYFKTPATWPSSSFNFLAVMNASFGNVAVLTVSGSGQPGQIRLVRTGGSVVVSSPNNTIQTDTWYRVELQKRGSTGHARVAVFAEEATVTPIWASNWEAHTDFATAIRYVTLGAISATPVVGTFDVDEVLLDALPAADGWLVPTAEPSEPEGEQSLQQRLTGMAAAVGTDVGRVQRSAHARPLAAFEASLSRSWINPCRIVWLGDSVTYGLSASPGMDYVSIVTRRLQAAYPSMIGGYEKPVVPLATGWPNLDSRPGVHSYRSAVGGANSDDYVNEVNEGFIWWTRPSLVVHAVGLNDSLSVEPYAVTVSEYQANVAAAVDSIDNAAAISSPAHKVSHILLHNYQRWETTASAWAEYRDALYEVAKTRPNVLVVDINEEFALMGAFSGDPAGLISADAVHPTDAGHALMAEVLLKKMGLSVPNDPSRSQTVLDTFIRPNVSPAGAPWEVFGSAVPAIVDNTLRITTGGTVMRESGLSNLWAETFVTLPAPASAGLPGLVFRGSNDSNRMGVFLNASSGVFQLYRTLSGSTAVAQQVSHAFPAGEYAVQVRAEGDRVLAFINGVKMIDYTMTTAEMTGLGGLTKIGFRNGTTAPDVQFHHIRAYPL